MAENWEYAEYTKWASEHGGPKAALNELSEYYTAKGFEEGANSKNYIVAIASLLGLGLGIGVKWVYDKYKSQKAHDARVDAEKRARVEETEAVLLASMEQNLDHDNSAVETKGVEDTDKAKSC